MILNKLTLNKFLTEAMDKMKIESNGADVNIDQKDADALIAKYCEVETTSVDLISVSKEELVQSYVDLGTQEEEIVAAKIEIRNELYNRVRDDGEVVGNYQVTKTHSYSFADVKIEQARELGATEEMKSSKKLKALFLKGAKIPCVVTNSVRIMEIKDKEVQTNI